MRRRNCDQLNATKFTRRELSLLAGSAFFGVRGLSLRKALASTVSSPKTTAWKDPMPVPKVAEKAEDFADYDAGEHQWCKGSFEPKKEYLFEAKASQYKFHSELPASTIWGYGDNGFAGTMIDAEYGEPIMIRVKNILDPAHKGFGQPEIATHLHNFHNAVESDGGPWNWTRPSGYRDQHYTMCRAGFTESRYAETYGDPRESLTTLFFHDHRPEFTSSNVYRGLIGMFRVFDEQDSGKEGHGWNLPCGEFDVPLIFADKQFDPRNGQMTFNQLAVDGFPGDKITVNGKIQPYFEVKPRKYRFRLLNGGPSRFYRVQFRNGGKSHPFTQITASGNFLPVARKNLTSTDVWVAERSDIVFDFSRFAGQKVYFSNTMVMRDDGRGQDYGATTNPDALANQMVEFRVGTRTEKDESTVPDRFRELPPVDLSEVVRTRVWRFERLNGTGQIWDPEIDHDPAYVDNPLVQVKRNTAEIWQLGSPSGGWDHPVHIHFEEGIAISNNGASIPAANRYRSDIHRMSGNRLQVYMRFRDFPDPTFDQRGPKGDISRYVMHCHDTLHEDHAMMATWTLVP
jgi:FtsP/CotA-like multicopper oxidase with cupredoxin domain